MFERMCEDLYETSIVRRLCGTIGLVLLAGEEGRLRGKRTALRLNPRAIVRPDNRARPQANLPRSEGRVRQLQDNATNVAIRKVVAPYELKVVEGTRVEE